MEEKINEARGDGGIGFWGVVGAIIVAVVILAIF